MAAKDSEKPATRKDLSLVRTELSQVRTELSQVRTELKGDIAKLDGKIDSVKIELKGDIARLDGKIDGVKSELKADINRLAVELVRTQADVREIKASMATKDDISRVLGAIDAFAKQTTDNRRTLLVYDDILGKHETRITALEAKSV